MDEKRMYQFAQGEFESASEALGKLSPQEALISFYTRLDAGIAKAIEES